MQTENFERVAKVACSSHKHQDRVSGVGSIHGTSTMSVQQIRLTSDLKVLSHHSEGYVRVWDWLIDTVSIQKNVVASSNSSTSTKHRSAEVTSPNCSLHARYTHIQTWHHMQNEQTCTGESTVQGRSGAQPAPRQNARRRLPWDTNTVGGPTRCSVSFDRVKSSAYEHVPGGTWSDSVPSGPANRKAVCRATPASKRLASTCNQAALWASINGSCSNKYIAAMVIRVRGGAHAIALRLGRSVPSR
jgi:hypothetical protein